jgi:hypothetical protein
MGELTIAGAWTAIITPFRDGAVDTAALDRLIDRQIDGGTDCIVSCGTTGESPTLSHAEHDAVIAQTIARANGRIPVVAGTGSNATSEAVRLTKAAAEAGAAGSLQVNPYYNKPGQEGLYRHFATVAEAVPDLPIILYNIPGRTGCRLEPDTVARLYQSANVVGMKEADGSVARVSDFLESHSRRHQDPGPPRRLGRRPRSGGASQEPLAALPRAVRGAQPRPGEGRARHARPLHRRSAPPAHPGDRGDQVPPEGHPRHAGDQGVAERPSRMGV